MLPELPLCTWIVPALPPLLCTRISPALPLRLLSFFSVFSFWDNYNVSVRMPDVVLKVS